MKRAVLYMRMSTDKQDNSIPAQRNILTDFAAKNKYKIIAEYKDEGISGRKAEKRPAFLQMVDDSSEGEFDTVLIYDSSRFARNLEESLVYKSALKKNGVTVVSATEPTLDEDTGLITDALLGAMNELYSRKLSKQVLRGMTETAKKGYCQTKPPFGYKATHEPGKFIPDPQNVPILKEMFQSYATNALSLSGIAKWVNTTYGHRYDSKTVAKILKSEFYIGNVIWNGIKAKGIHEPIIDIETYNKVQKRYAGVTYKRDPNSNKHWLSGLVKCGYCGKSMSFTNSRWPAFKCNKKSIGLCTHNNRVRSYKVEDNITNALNSLYTGSELIKLEQIVITNNTADEQTKIETAIKRLKNKLERAKQLYLDGIDDIEEFKVTKAVLTKEMKALHEKCVSLNHNIPDKKRIAETFKTRAETIIDFLNDAEKDNTQRNEMLRTIIHRIEYKRDSNEFIIFYNL